MGPGCLSFLALLLALLFNPLPPSLQSDNIAWYALPLPLNSIPFFAEKVLKRKMSFRCQSVIQFFFIS